MRRFLLASMALLSLVSGAHAADKLVDQLIYRPGPTSVANFGWQTEFGGRYWYSSGKTQLDLFGPVQPFLLSRLTFSGLTGHSGELYGRVDHSVGFFFKGNVGLGRIVSGNLQDEDFPPLTSPYSSTNSEQRSGNLSYLTADLGWAFWNTPTVKVGAFVGYHYYAESVNAFGCTQAASNPAICVPAISTSVLGITEESNWNAARIGINGVWRITDRFTLTADAAWIPYARLNARDFHWLRIGTSFNGPTPEDGNGFSAQLEAILSYNVTRQFSVGIGGRYWRFEPKSNGSAHFEVSGIDGGFPQPINFKTERYGGFVQASYIFGAPIVAANY
jgi:opacity protein-like surface antigen